MKWVNQVFEQGQMKNTALTAKTKPVTQPIRSLWRVGRGSIAVEQGQYGQGGGCYVTGQLCLENTISVDFASSQISRYQHTDIGTHPLFDSLSKQL